MLTITLIILLLSLVNHGHSFPKQARQDWEKVGREELRAALASRPRLGVARNVILFLGDGMGVSNVMASRVYNAQRLGTSYRDASMEFEKFPYLGLSMTYNADRMVTGSAASAGAYLCGEKSNYGTIAVNQDVTRGRCDTVAGNELSSILEHSNHAGKWTGVVSTARVTHASPSASYAASADRNWEADSYQPPDVRGKCKDIARQLIEDNDIRVVLGGGRSMFMPNTSFDPEYQGVRGMRQDGRDLIKEWKMKKDDGNYKYEYVRNKEEFDNIDPSDVDYVMGLFEPLHMKYEVDRNKGSDKDDWGEPSIAEMTEKAIQILQRSEEGYFLFVEGGRIDHAHHAGNAFRALNETVALSDAVKRAVDMTNEEDTLIIVTADHSHAFTVGGYPSINTNILGLVTTANGSDIVDEIADDKMPYTILSYANGPGFIYHHTNGSINSPNAKRRDLTEDAHTGRLYGPDYQQDAAVPLIDETHGGEEVAIYARGPMGHLFHKTHEQTHVAHVMMYASCVGPYQESEHCPKNTDIYRHWPTSPPENTSTAYKTYPAPLINVLLLAFTLVASMISF